MENHHSKDHILLAKIYGDTIDQDIRTKVLSFVFENVNKAIGVNLINELNRKAKEKEQPPTIIDIGCGRMGVGITLTNLGLNKDLDENKRIKMVGVDIINYHQELIEPYSEIIHGDITDEKTLNTLSEKARNQKFSAIIGSGLPPQIIEELLDKKDELIALLDEEGFILFIIDQKINHLSQKHPEFKFFRGKSLVDEAIIYYQKPT